MYTNICKNYVDTSTLLSLSKSKNQIITEILRETYIPNY